MGVSSSLISLDATSSPASLRLHCLPPRHLRSTSTHFPPSASCSPSLPYPPPRPPSTASKPTLPPTVPASRAPGFPPTRTSTRTGRPEAVQLRTTLSSCIIHVLFASPFRPRRSRSTSEPHRSSTRHPRPPPRTSPSVPQARDPTGWRGRLFAGTTTRSCRPLAHLRDGRRRPRPADGSSSLGRLPPSTRRSPSLDGSRGWVSATSSGPGQKKTRRVGAYLSPAVGPRQRRRIWRQRQVPPHSPPPRPWSLSPRHPPCLHSHPSFYRAGSSRESSLEIRCPLRARWWRRSAGRRTRRWSLSGSPSRRRLIRWKKLRLGGSGSGREGGLRGQTTERVDGTDGGKEGVTGRPVCMLSLSNDRASEVVLGQKQLRSACLLLELPVAIGGQRSRQASVGPADSEINRSI